MTVRPLARSDADDLVQSLDLARGQARRRLVQHDEVRLAGERPQDLDLLLFGDRTGRPTTARPRGRTRPDRPAPSKRSASGAAVDEPGPPRLGAEEDVLDDGQPRDEGHFLGDDRDAAHQRLAGRPERHRRPPQDQVALVRGNTPAMILPSVDLPAPFSPTKAWTVPRRTTDGHVVEGAGRPEGLPESADVQEDVLAAISIASDVDEVDGQPGHSASGRKVSTLALVTTPPSGRLSSGSMPAPGSRSGSR